MTGEGASTEWVNAFSPHDGPRYLQIVDFMERAISEERLRPGDRLPPQRQLADLLKVDLTTITRAYNEAKRRNLLEAHGAAGTYVSAPKVDLTQMPDLSMNIPPPSSVNLEEAIRQGLSQTLIRNDVNLLMTYHLAGGSAADRITGAQWLSPMFDNIYAGRLLVCPGAQAAIAALMLSLSRPGDVILTEPMVYPCMQSAAAQFDRKLVAVESDKDGMIPEALEEACKLYNARLVYLNPTLQNPTNNTMPAQRRMQIAEVLARCNIRVIEDDPYWLFANNPPKPLAYYAPDHVYYISSLSKCLTPGLRTAYVLFPKGADQEAFLAGLRSFALMSTPLMTALATYWINEGTATAIWQGTDAESRTRQELAMRILGNKNQESACGIHVWHKLPSHWTSLDFTAEARKHGLNVLPAEAFCIGENTTNAIRISLGRGKDRFGLATALRKLADLAARQHVPHAGSIV